MSDSCSQHHSGSEGNCHFCVYLKCLHPPFLIHGMFVLIGQEENLLALKLPVFWAYHQLVVSGGGWRGRGQSSPQHRHRITPHTEYDQLWQCIRLLIVLSSCYLGTLKDGGSPKTSLYPCSKPLCPQCEGSADTYSKLPFLQCLICF